MPWTPAQSGNLNPATSRFFPNAVILNSPGTSQSITGTGSGIFIPFSNLESYKVATSGDVRELAYSIVDKVNNGLAALSGLPDQPQSTIFKIAKSTQLLATNSFGNRYVIDVTLTGANTVYDVSDEP